MLWNPGTSAQRRLSWTLLGFSSLLLRIAWALPGNSENCTLKMTLHNFRLILSWEFHNQELPPTHYTLWYTIMSKNEKMRIVEDCAHITRSFCDLTHVWRDLGETYIPEVARIQGNQTLASCTRDIRLATNMSLEPPKFEIVGSTDCIRVIINIPPDVSGLLRDLLFNTPLVIEERSDRIVKKHKPKISGNMAGDFSYTIDKLTPNTNHCISVYFEHSNPEVAPAMQCVLLRPDRDSESSESGKIGGIIFMLLVVAAIPSTLTVMRRTGYICLRYDFPRVLNLNKMPACVFLELLPSEKIDLVEVILVNTKKKAWHNHDDKDDKDDDESDSEDEEVARTSPGGYTMHGLLGRLLSATSSTSSTTMDSPNDMASEEADPTEPEAETEPLVVPRPGLLQRVSGACEGGTGHLPRDSFAEEEDSSTEGSGGRMFFNVDLKSVCVRSLEDENSSDALVLSLPEEAMDTEVLEETDSGLVEASIAEAWLPLAEGLWPDAAPSEESDSSSESNFCFGDGYLAR